MSISRTVASVLDLPNEIQDNIALNIVDFSDLVAFGLSCKALCRLILPRHTKFHTLTARLQDRDIWNHVILNRNCASTIRFLVVQSDEDEVPRSLGVMSPAAYLYPDSALSEPEEQREERFVQALVGMANLRSFRWRRTPPRGDALWSALAKLKRLCSMEIEYADALSGENWSMAAAPPRSFTCCPISKASFLLRKFTLTLLPDCRVSGNPCTSFLSTITSLVDECPRLESLNLSTRIRGIHVQQFKDALLRARWPNLHTLELLCIYGNTLDRRQAEVEEFCRFHQNITTLRWRMGDRVESDESLLPMCMVQTFPNLQTLDATPKFAKRLLTSECNPPRPLKNLESFQLGTPSEVPTVNDFIGIDKMSLRTIKLHYLFRFSDLSRLANIFPNIEYLRLPSRIYDSVWDDDRGCMRKLLSAEWALTLQRLPTLREIIGLYFFADADPLLDLEENHQRAKWLVRLFPQLERFGILNREQLLIEIKRHGDGKISWENEVISSVILDIDD